MKAAFITKYGNASEAFELIECDKPIPSEGEVCIEVEVFGINFADVLSRKGMYREAPPIPYIPGYDCVGTITSVGPGVDSQWVGKRVAAMTRFGAYAEFCTTKIEGIVEIPFDMDAGQATSLCVQYTTAYYAAYHCMNLLPGERVLIHAGAGGVGLALIDLCKLKGCEIFATAGSDEKVALLKSLGVHHAINYRTIDYEREISGILGKQRLDASFNAVAGSTYKKDMRLLGSAGRMVLYGAAERSDWSRGKMALYRLLWKMGIQLPILLMAKSQTIIGVNILKVADHKTAIIKQCFDELLALWNAGKINPRVGAKYPIADLAKAHEAMEQRKTTGKIVVEW